MVNSSHDRHALPASEEATPRQAVADTAGESQAIRTSIEALLQTLTDRGVLGLAEPGPRKRARGRRRVVMVGSLDDIPRSEWR